MPLLDAYAQPEDYEALITSGRDLGASDPIADDLTAMSRVLDHELQLPPGAFNQSEASTTRYFDGTGSPLLRLRDGRGRLNPIIAIDAEGIQVDTTGDGTFDTTFDLTDPWAVAEPYNAAEVGEPWTALRILDLPVAQASVGELLKVFPPGRHNVAVVGTYGWAAVPEAVKRLVIFMTRDLRERLAAGASGTFQMLDSGIVVRDETWRSIQRMKRAYSHRIPAVA